MIVLCILIISILAYATWVQRSTIKRGMPPGFYLECSNDGKYRACRNGRPLLHTDSTGTKYAAIKRAWDQFDYEAKINAQTWSRCEESDQQ